MSPAISSFLNAERIMPRPMQGSAHGEADRHSGRWISCSCGVRRAERLVRLLPLVVQRAATDILLTQIAYIDEKTCPVRRN